MAIDRITSLDDPKLAPYRSLKRSNHTRWAGQFVAEGEKLVRRLLDSNLQVESLLVAERHADEFACLSGERVPVLAVPGDWVEQIVGFNFHRGILACARRPVSPDLLQLCNARQGSLTLVACPDVQDPENLGSILRLSGAFGVDAVVLGPDCCDPFSRRVLRVSMGAAFRTPIVECADLAETLAQVRNQCQVRLWGTVVHTNAERFDQAPRPERLALVFGSEGHGLSQLWQNTCDRLITIPMREGTDSLNVAVAFGILLYGLTRRPEP